MVNFSKIFHNSETPKCFKISFSEGDFEDSVDVKLMSSVLSIFKIFHDELFVNFAIKQAESLGKITVPSIYGHGIAICDKSIYSHRNFLIFEDGDKCFCLLQSPEFVWAIWLPEENFFFSFGVSSVLASSLILGFKDKVDKYPSLLEDSESRVFRGFINGYNRPYHYFYDRVPALLLATDFLSNVKVLSVKRDAFLSLERFVDKEIFVDSLNDYLMYNSGFLLEAGFHNLSDNSYCVGQKRLNECLVSQFLEKNNEKESIMIWLGICFEKRPWPERKDSIVSIINKSLKEFESPVFVFDGMTCPVSLDKEIFIANNCNEELRFLAEVFSSVGKRFRSISLIGEKADKKIATALRCDFFFSSALTDSIWPSRFARLPGIVYCANAVSYKNRSLHYHYKAAYLPGEHIRDIDDGGSNWAKVGYSISPSLVSDLVVSSALANFNIKRLLKPYLLSAAANKSYNFDFSECHSGLLFKMAKSSCSIASRNLPPIYVAFAGAESFRSNDQAIVLTRGRWKFIFDAVTTFQANCQLVLVFYRSGEKVSTHFIQPTESFEIDVDADCASYRPFLRFRGQGEVNYRGFSVIKTG